MNEKVFIKLEDGRTAVRLNPTSGIVLPEDISEELKAEIKRTAVNYRRNSAVFLTLMFALFLLMFVFPLFFKSTAFLDFVLDFCPWASIIFAIPFVWTEFNYPKKLKSLLKDCDTAALKYPKVAIIIAVIVGVFVVGTLVILNGAIKIEKFYMKKSYKSFENGDYSSALKQIETAEKFSLFGGNAHNWLFKAQIKKQTGDSEGVLQCYNKAIEQIDKDAEYCTKDSECHYTYLLRADIKRIIGDYCGAAEDYSRALNVKSYDKFTDPRAVAEDLKEAEIKCQSK